MPDNLQWKLPLNPLSIPRHQATDHRRGIPEDDKPYIINCFYCADKSRTDKSNFGLGLSIADELAKMMNGNVGCEDTDGGRATFFVTHPLK